ncbi:MAG TPA: hypothetical protein VGJ82_17835, partial [Thermoanaerobaculia bacterium]
ESYAVAKSSETVWALRIPSLQPARIAAPQACTTAVGWTYEELLSRAIVGAALLQVTTLGPIEIDAPRVQRLLRIAGRLGMHVELREARAPYGVPAVTAAAGGRQESAAGMSLADAAEEALLALLAPQCGARVAAVAHPPALTARRLLDNVAAAGASGVLIPYAAIPCRGRSLFVAGFSWL